MTATLGKIVLILAAGYVLIAIVAYFAQRKLTYFPSTERVAPAEVGLIGVDELTLDTPDGEKVLAWYAKAQPSQPTLLYFHGNGGNLALRSERIRRLVTRGFGLLIMSYRGYSGSSGYPSEAANLADARLAYQRLAELGVQPDDVILYGESLGTGIATRLATELPVSGLILESPYTSIPDVGASRYPYLPVRALMKDRYDQLSCIGRIRAPLLVIHGMRDGVVPFKMGQTVFAAAPEPKAFVALEKAGHNDHARYGGPDAIAAWIARLRSGEIANVTDGATRNGSADRRGCA